jgi:hypothetical protein
MSKSLLIKPVGAKGNLINLLDKPLTVEEFREAPRTWEKLKGSGVGQLPTYYCSDYGEVYGKYGDSNILRPLNNQMLGNYPAVHLSLLPSNANSSVAKSVHLIVAERDDFPIRKSLLRYVNGLEKWIINEKLQVDHLNRNSYDSSRYNLQWVTADENQDRRKSNTDLPRIKRKSLAEGEVTMAEVDTSVRYNY